VHHRTVRWPHLSELQQSNPNGWVTWLAHRTVSGGTPNCPVRPSTAEFPNDQSIQKLELDLTPNTETSVQCFGVGEKMSTTSQLVV
jgi:hypothetical protein